MGAVEPILAIAAAVLLGIVGAREVAAGMRCGKARHRSGQFGVRRAAVYWSLLSVQAVLFLGAATTIYLVLFSR